MPVYRGDVKALVEAGTTALSPKGQFFACFAASHIRMIVESCTTDIKHDNIFFSTIMTVDDIETWVAKEPSRRYALEASRDGMVQAAFSQPLPMTSGDEDASYNLPAEFGWCVFLPNFFDSDTHHRSSGLHDN